jgi:hypothetical protein
MNPDEFTTGTRDEHYNLVAVLYHALKGADTIESYILDAEATGDERLSTFFRETRDTYRHLAQQAKELLGILATPPEEGISPSGISGGIPSAVESGITLDTISGGIPLNDREAGELSAPKEDPPPLRAVPPDAPRTETPPPRVGDAPASPSEEPPSEEHLPRQGP